MAENGVGRGLRDLKTVINEMPWFQSIRITPSMLKCVFRHFTCIRNRPKNGSGRSHCFPMELGDEFFVVSVAPKAKSERVLD